MNIVNLIIKEKLVYWNCNLICTQLGMFQFYQGIQFLDCKRNWSAQENLQSSDALIYAEWDMNPVEHRHCNL